MSKSNENNSGLLAVIAVVLVGILGVLIYQANQDSPAEEVAESISGAIDDASNN
jgi:hypothetical protein